MTEGRAPRPSSAAILGVSLLGVIAVGLQLLLGFAVALMASSRANDPGAEGVFSIVKVAVGGLWIASLVGIILAWAKLNPVVIAVPIVALGALWLIKAVTEALIPYSLGLGY
ncbi:MAG: hypothetical protein ACJ767_03200 [Chloroflexota bacterium]